MLPRYKGQIVPRMHDIVEGPQGDVGTVTELHCLDECPYAIITNEHGNRFDVSIPTLTLIQRGE